MTTLTTVGYGDISPIAEGGVGGTHATFEIVVTLFVEMASAIVFGYIIGSLTSILSREDRSRVMLSEKIDEITSYMNSRGIDGLLQKRVVAFYDQVSQHQAYLAFLASGVVPLLLPTTDVQHPPHVRPFALSIPPPSFHLRLSAGACQLFLMSV